jgi:hypothetical protein
MRRRLRRDRHPRDRHRRIPTFIFNLSCSCVCVCVCVCACNHVHDCEHGHEHDHAHEGVCVCVCMCVLSLSLISRSSILTSPLPRLASQSIVRRGPAGVVAVQQPSAKPLGQCPVMRIMNATMPMLTCTYHHARILGHTCQCTRPQCLLSNRLAGVRRPRLHDVNDPSAAEFVESVGTGKSHPKQVVAVARALQHKLPDDPVVRTFASLGGPALSIVERDFHRRVHSLYGSCMSPFYIPLTIQTSDGVQTVNFLTLAPYEVLAGLHQSGRPSATAMFGSHSVDSVSEYWDLLGRGVQHHINLDPAYAPTKGFHAQKHPHACEPYYSTNLWLSFTKQQLGFMINLNFSLFCSPSHFQTMFGFIVERLCLCCNSFLSLVCKVICSTSGRMFKDAPSLHDSQRWGRYIPKH